jgi:hypothetical protein
MKMGRRLVEYGKINASSFLEVTSELADFIMQEKDGDAYENYIFRDESGSYNYTEEGQEIFNNYLGEVETYLNSAGIYHEGDDE